MEMNRVISWFKECDGHFCDMVAQCGITLITIAVMFHCISAIS